MIPDWFRQLLTPLVYLRISRRPKFVVDVVLPCLFAAAVVVLHGIAPKSLPLLGADGIVGTINSALPNLVGFYIAALAAVTGLNSASLDQPLADGMRLPGAKSTVIRRDFLCYLFGYLSFLGFVLLFLGMFGRPVHAFLNAWLHGAVQSAIFTTITFVYFALLFGLFFTTLLGLYFLVYRSRSADPKIIDGGPPREQHGSRKNNLTGLRRRTKRRAG